MTTVCTTKPAHLKVANPSRKFAEGQDPLIQHLTLLMHSHPSTLKEIAQRANISPKTITRWRHGKHRALLSEYVAVLNALGYTLTIRKEPPCT